MHVPQDRDTQQPRGENGGDVRGAVYMENGVFSYSNSSPDGKYAYKSNI